MNWLEGQSQCVCGSEEHIRCSRLAVTAALHQVASLRWNRLWGYFELWMNWKLRPARSVFGGFVMGRREGICWQFRACCRKTKHSVFRGVRRCSLHYPCFIPFLPSIFFKVLLFWMQYVSSPLVLASCTFAPTIGFFPSVWVRCWLRGIPPISKCWSAFLQREK